MLGPDGTIFPFQINFGLVLFIQKSKIAIYAAGFQTWLALLESCKQEQENGGTPQRIINRTPFRH